MVFDYPCGGGFGIPLRLPITMKDQLKFHPIDSWRKICQKSMKSPKNNIDELSYPGCERRIQVRGSFLVTCGNSLKDIIQCMQ